MSRKYRITYTVEVDLSTPRDQLEHIRRYLSMVPYAERSMDSSCEVEDITPKPEPFKAGAIVSLSSLAPRGHGVIGWVHIGNDQWRSLPDGEWASGQESSLREDVKEGRRALLFEGIED